MWCPSGGTPQAQVILYGELFVALDEGYIGSDNGTFFVIVGGEESNDYEQAGSDLFISFPAGTEKIEIFGSYVLL